MDGIAKIYPAKELKAVDMAELMKAALMFNGVLHGCKIEVASNRLRMSPGRIVIFGRLAEFAPDSGESYLFFDAPSVSARTKFMICAISDLNNSSNSFYISLLGPSAYNSLVAEVSGDPTDENYNTVGGKRFVRLGEVYYDSSGTPSSLNVSATDFPSGKPRSNSKVLQDYRSTLNDKDATYMAWIRYLNKARHHQNGFFKTKTVNLDGVIIPANTSGLFVFRKDYNADVQVVAENSGSIPSSMVPHTFIWKRNGYRGTGVGAANENKPWAADGVGQTPSVTPSQTYEHDAPVDINIEDNYKVWYGVIGVQIDNATSGGAGSANCVLQGFYQYDVSHIAIKVRNTGSTAATVKIAARSLYIQNIDFPS